MSLVELQIYIQELENKSIAVEASSPHAAQRPATPSAHNPVSTAARGKVTEGRVKGCPELSPHSFKGLAPHSGFTDTQETAHCFMPIYSTAKSVLN